MAGIGQSSSPSASEVVVRQAVLSDLDAAAELFDQYRQFQGQPADRAVAKAFLRERFEHGESAVFLAVSPQGAVGFAQLYPSFSSVSLARVFILNDLFVAQAGRRKGVASRLLEAVENYAWSLGACRISLNVGHTNEPGQALYEARGWSRDVQFHMYHRYPAERIVPDPGRPRPAAQHANPSGEPMDTNRIDAERKHLEGLLKDRISFFLLFAPVLVAASYNIRDHPLIRAWVLLTGTVVSLLLALAIYRTHCFVELALKDIVQDADHPYTRYRAAIRWPPNANKLLIPIPFLLCAMFLGLTIVSFCAGTP